MKRTTWKVYPCAPGQRDVAWRLKAVPPPGVRSIVLYKEAKATNLAEARAEGEAWESEINRTLILERDPTVSAVIERHATHREADGKTRARTVLAYREAAEALRPLIGDLRGSELTRAHVLRAQDSLAARLGPGSVNLHVSCAAHAWTWAHARELVAMAWPKVDRLPSKPTNKRPFTDREVGRVLAWFQANEDGRWFPFFSLMADTGARVGELVALVGGDLDHEARTVRVLSETAKTEEARTIAVPPETMALLPRVEDEARVFVPLRHAYRTHALSRMIPLRALRRAMKSLGFKAAEVKRLDQHSFRRSFVATTVRLGVPLPVSMKATGHRSVKVHLDYQRAAVGDDMHDLAARVRASRTSLTVPGPVPEVQTVAGSRGRSSWRSVHEQRSTPERASLSDSAPGPEKRTESHANTRACVPLWSGAKHPHGDWLAAKVAENPAAMWALLNDPALLVWLRAAALDAIPSLHAPAASPEPARKSHG